MKFKWFNNKTLSQQLFFNWNLKLDLKPNDKRNEIDKNMNQCFEIVNSIRGSGN